MENKEFGNLFNKPKYAYFSIKIPGKELFGDTESKTTSHVAKLLGITVKTLKNREDKGIYPKPKKYLRNSYRYYSKEDIENLQRIDRERPH
jgi:hypothetical protein